MTQPAQSSPSLLRFVPDEGKTARRQRAAQLLEAVIDERMEPRMAINRWPEPIKEPDLSMDCAYQALWHFEADEDKQKTEMFYMDAQLELLRQMARHFKAGQDFPPYILTLYRKKSPIRFFYSLSPWADGFAIARRCWQEVRHIWQQAIDVCLEPPKG